MEELKNINCFDRLYLRRAKFMYKTCADPKYFLRGFDRLYLRQLMYKACADPKYFLRGCPNSQKGV